MHYYTTFTSPLGKITAQANELGLTGVWFETHTTQPQDLGKRDDHHVTLQQAQQQITEFFAQERTCFELPLAAEGTPFQQQVWQALLAIPYGQTWSYQQIANHIGNPKAVRAVGAANGKNPISVIVPCHRVIGASGKLTGYAGGIERKQALLALERSTSND
ncbi:methylated-DNA--[protein]-cysteine S-methyltransferase [Vibrio astriarenae]|jgi:methylated-DNA-[protein]-cysteine S-methyltransferase|uniref:methylated-DNA--[protein]-cysteine S-methyltransferase n=1 Tax=Vibrio agarivorans TaxID=153622 RepID=UPI0022325E0D|nr:methylated-DNA--[protein]-cysteine S-methyltransferase [Vibrio agarivorans]MDN3663038.1 methylated-DNA--[protein]-cysteine S-methyltransferase [Vibrio agarivorans]